MNISVKTACKVYVRVVPTAKEYSPVDVWRAALPRKRGVTPSDKCFFARFFGDFFTKNLVYEKLNPYICRCVMEYPLVGASEHIYY